MTRTKLAKYATKRNSTRDEKTANIIRDFDAQVESALSNYESMFKTDMEFLSNKIDMIKNRIPQSLLSMTLKELRNFDVKTFDEISANINQLSIASTSVINNSQPVIIINKNSLRKQSKDDEGYLTETSCQSVSKNQSRIAHNVGVLSSTTTLRRSKSCTGSISSNINSTISKNRFTPAPGSIPHNSRPRFRTPIITKRIKASSADQLGPITPKMQSNMPVTMLRYAKAGEQLISLSGSPVFASNCNTANINIPIKNGILSLLPNKMQSIDYHEIISKIDAETLNHLKQLQTNLNLIMHIKED